jgi:hypothetical protein
VHQVHAGILTDYGADVFGVGWVYVPIRIGRTIFGRRFSMDAPGAAVIVCVASVAWELAERVHLIPGTYDPYDIVAYAVAATLCWSVDRIRPLTCRG